MHEGTHHSQSQINQVTGYSADLDLLLDFERDRLGLRLFERDLKTKLVDKKCVIQGKNSFSIPYKLH